MLENFSNQAAALAISILAAALSACASIPDAGAPTAGDPRSSRPVRADVQVRHTLASATETDGEMLSGSVSLDTPGGLIDYGARYEVRQGKLFEAIRDGRENPEAAQDEVALQTMEQTLGSTLPLPLGSPLKLAFTSREQSRLGVEGGRQSHSARADLQWSPGPVELRMQWDRPQANSSSTGGVNCDLRADVQLPAEFMPGVAGSVLEFSGQRCRGQDPTHGLNDLDIARWGAAWRWGAKHASALRLVRTEPAASIESHGLLTPDYELGLSHDHRLPGGWQARADISMLRADATAHSFARQATESATDWSANVALKRELNLLAITARWAHAAERLWFATAVSPVAQDRFSLGLDFGAWLTRLWPSLQTAMDLSWDWRETREGDSDGKVSWNLLIGW